MSEESAQRKVPAFLVHLAEQDSEFRCLGGVLAAAGSSWVGEQLTENAAGGGADCKAIKFGEADNDAFVGVGVERGEGRNFRMKRIEPETVEAGTEGIGGGGRRELASLHLADHSAHAELARRFLDLPEPHPLGESVGVSGSCRG